MNKRVCYNKADLGFSFALAVSVMVLAQIVLSLAFSPAIDPETKVMEDWAFWCMQALYTLCLGSSALIYAKISKTNLFVATKLNAKPKLAHIGWGCLSVLFLIALMLPVNEWLMDLIESLGFNRPSVDMPVQAVPMVLVACVLPAFTEEIVFRGTVSQSLFDCKNKWGSLAVCGALFAIYHLNPAQTVHQFVLGAFLTLLVFRSGSLFTSVAVHFFNNIVAVVLTFVVTDEKNFTDYGIVLATVGLVGFALCVFGYLKTTKSSWQSKQGEEHNQQEQVQTGKMQDKKLSLACLIAAVAVCLALWIVNLVS